MLDMQLWHDDHFLNQEQKDYVHRQVQANNPQDGAVFTYEIVLPERLCEGLETALYGEGEGDEPITEDMVFYAKRGDREWEDRMIKRPMRPTNRVQAIGVVIEKENKILYFTIYGGAYAPQNPADPSNRDVEGAKKHWAVHALSHDLLNQ